MMLGLALPSAPVLFKRVSDNNQPPIIFFSTACTAVIVIELAHEG